jgi:predicted transcriptional regulator
MMSESSTIDSHFSEVQKGLLGKQRSRCFSNQGRGAPMTAENTPDNAANREYAAGIVSAYVANNSLPASDLPALLQSVHAALVGLTTGQIVATIAPPQKEPAVSIKKSVTPDFIICLEDGKKFKSLKRHLRTAYSMTPEEYRAKWGLASDYPMVAPNYAKTRSELATKMGLGQKRKVPASKTRKQATKA